MGAKSGELEAKGRWREDGGSKKTEMRRGDIVEGEEKILARKGVRVRI